MSRITLPVLAAAAALVAVTALSGCAPEPGTTTPTSTASGSGTAPAPAPDAGAAAAYCLEKGGEIQHRQPTFGTNNARSTWVDLGETVETCRFRTGEGETATAIYVDPNTLYSEHPTLAALAYLAKVPLPSDTTANPASRLCVELGGAVAYGPTAAGGGLVLADDPFEVVAVCTFADGSFIDEWGIGYYSAGTVRGADLAPMFRFDTAALPPVFTGAAG